MAPSGNEPEEGGFGRAEDPIPRRRFLVGRTLNDVIARAPWLWPLLRPPLRRFFDSAAREWEARTGADQPEHLAPLSAGAMHVRPRPERILELGTGTGTGALLLAREFPEARVRGVDISGHMIAAAKAKVGLDPEGRIAFRIADAAGLPYDDDSFDLVAQLNMTPFFRETARVLRPGGHVVVATSGGPAVPFYTPHPVLERGFRRQGLELVEEGTVARGTFFVARKPGGPSE